MASVTVNISLLQIFLQCSCNVFLLRETFAVLGENAFSSSANAFLISEVLYMSGISLIALRNKSFIIIIIIITFSKSVLL